MNKIIKNISYLIISVNLAALTPNAHADSAKKIVKWKDDQGVTHYGDVLPSQEAGRGNALLNKEGVVIKKNESYQQSDLTNKAADLVYAEQLRKDSALLASYSSIEEIDLALERNVQTEKNSLKVLTQRLYDAKETLKSKQSVYDSNIKNKKTPAAYLLDDIKANQQKITKTQSEITATENNIALMQTRFANYKSRYAELRPRNQALSRINVNKKTLAELELWKRQANEKLSLYLNETIKYKRSGSSIPKEINDGIDQANQEIARADQEIASIKASIKNSQETFSSR